MSKNNQLLILKLQNFCRLFILTAPRLIMKTLDKNRFHSWIEIGKKLLGALNNKQNHKKLKNCKHFVSN